MIKVLLVDDQELIRAGLRGILRAQFGFEIVGECPDGGAVPAAVDTLMPDVVLMDVRMPLVDGVTATRRRGTAATPRRSSRSPLSTMTRCWPGCSGLARPASPARASPPRTCSARSASWPRAAPGSIPASPPGCWPPTGRRPPRRSPRGAELAALTAREREVLALIGRGKTNTEIASALFVGEGTVKTHVNHVFAKLGLRDRAAAVIFALDHNLTGLPG